MPLCLLSGRLSLTDGFLARVEEPRYLRAALAALALPQSFPGEHRLPIGSRTTISMSVEGLGIWTNLAKQLQKPFQPLLNCDSVVSGYGEGPWPGGSHWAEGNGQGPIRGWFSPFSSQDTACWSVVSVTDMQAARHSYGVCLQGYFV